MKTIDVDFAKEQEHNAAELICVKCGRRWIGVWPEFTLLKELECPNCGPGFVIKTGQDMENWT